MSLRCAIKTKKELGEKNCFLIVKTLINIQKDFSHKRYLRAMSYV